jgi:hypothetical protein
MRVALITNLKSRGLCLDATLIGAFLASNGHEPTFIQYDEPRGGEYDLLLFFETVAEDKIALSKTAPWLFVNPEFIYDRDIDLILRKFGKVLCKTKEAFRICSELFPEQAVYTGFMAQDRFDADIPRARNFLHVAGSSRVKGTQQVVDAWKWRHNGKGIDAPLIVVSDWFEDEQLPPNVQVVKEIDDEALKLLQNSCLFHLQPSGTEGFGHTIRESLSVGATLLTTNVAPMNEVKVPYLVPSVGSYQFHKAEIHEVSALHIHEAVQAMLILETHDFAQWKPREIFLQGNEEFKQNFAALLAEFKPDAPKIVYSRKREWEGQKRVAYLGNFLPPYSTENDIAWTLEHLGHEVIRLQENAFNEKQFGEAREACDMFLWTHTHQFSNITDLLMEHLLDWFKEHGKPTVSFHLDKFWGIPEREKRIGSDPFFKTDFVFTADGGFQDQFAAHGINHIWSPPGVVERDCHYGTPREQYRCDVAFVGSVDGYHECYPFRREMVEFLKDRYRHRFRTFLHVRGPDLNDLYASCKVAVGDCIFAGTPHYWSDRLPETYGRGGCLVHPMVEGMTIPSAFYEPQNLESLAYAIDELLRGSQSRRSFTRFSHEHVRANDTYTQRIETILKMVFP